MDRSSKRHLGHFAEGGGRQYSQGVPNTAFFLMQRSGREITHLCSGQSSPPVKLTLRLAAGDPEGHQSESIKAVHHVEGESTVWKRAWDFDETIQAAHPFSRNWSLGGDLSPEEITNPLRWSYFTQT